MKAFPPSYQRVSQYILHAGYVYANLLGRGSGRHVFTHLCADEGVMV